MITGRDKHVGGGVEWNLVRGSRMIRVSCITFVGFTVILKTSDKAMLYFLFEVNLAGDFFVSKDPNVFIHICSCKLWCKKNISSPLLSFLKIFNISLRRDCSNGSSLLVFPPWRAVLTCLAACLSLVKCSFDHAKSV